MTDKELKKLRRVDLLEMLVEAGKQIEDLQKQLAAAEEKLKEREIKIEQSGSIAEAALKLNGIFEAAQKAADQYLENIRMQAQLAEKEAEPEASQQADSQQESVIDTESAPEEGAQA